MPSLGTPDKYKAMNVQLLTCTNDLDENGHPTGGEVVGAGLTVHWQNGPRTPDAEGNLAPSNGAFVEDVIYAALQRLEFFQKSEFATIENEKAISQLENALVLLDQRRQDRKARGVEGKHEV
jgi:hypothetical protein